MLLEWRTQGVLDGYPCTPPKRASFGTHPQMTPQIWGHKGQAYTGQTPLLGHPARPPQSGTTPQMTPWDRVHPQI